MKTENELYDTVLSAKYKSGNEIIEDRHDHQHNMSAGDSASSPYRKSLRQRKLHKLNIL